MNKNQKINVRNRSASSLSYIIPDMNNFRRRFSAGELKEIPFEEVKKLTYMPGGDYILQHYLVIENIEARDEILGEVELEYSYSEEDVKNLLERGSNDQLLDCLDFAPLGVIDMVKRIATETELNDLRKRKIILDKTGFNVDAAIQINKETNTVEEEQKAVRRVKTETVAQTNEENAPAQPQRRYNVVKK